MYDVINSTNSLSKKEIFEPSPGFQLYFAGSEEHFHPAQVGNEFI
jgi:hypothetical protein